MPLLISLLCAAMLLDAPAGRPPEGALDRYDPRAYNLRYEVTIATETLDRMPVRPQARRIAVEDTPIMFPLILQSTFSEIDLDSLTPRLLPDYVPDETISDRARIDDGLPLNQHLAVLPIEEFEGTAIRWEVGYDVKVWNSRINDEAAAGIAWPAEWPEEVRDALDPQQYIESDAELFAQTVERVSEGRLREITPYIAAKELVRYSLLNLHVSSKGIIRRHDRAIVGLRIEGAEAAAQRGQASRPDVVNICVAMLRSAGIPARAVIGTREDPARRNKGEYDVWGEFYLPDTGWVPFDINELRAQNLRALSVHEPWRGFGNLRNHNRRIPLAYHYLPPVTAQSPQEPAIWGWDPRPATSQSLYQTINMRIRSHGRVEQ